MRERHRPAVAGRLARELERVERRSRVAARSLGQELERLGFDARAAALAGRRPGRSSVRTSSAVSASSSYTSRARDQRRVDLEVRVLGRRADQRDQPVLDRRQQRVLLGLVEAVDLVEEEDRRPSAAAQPLPRALDHRPHLGAAGLDRALLLERGARRVARPPARASSCRCPAGRAGSSSAGWPSSIARRSAEPGASSRSWPTNSSSVPRPHPGRERRVGGSSSPCSASGSENRRSIQKYGPSVHASTAERPSAPARRHHELDSRVEPEAPRPRSGLDHVAACTAPLWSRVTSTRQPSCFRTVLATAKGACSSLGTTHPSTASD